MLLPTRRRKTNNLISSRQKSKPISHLNAQEERIKSGVVREARIRAIAQQEFDCVYVVVVRGPEKRGGLQFPSERVHIDLCFQRCILKQVPNGKMYRTSC